MNKILALTFVIILFISCKLLKPKNNGVVIPKPYCFEEFDSARYLRFWGPNPKFGTSDDWGMMTENGVMIGGDCIHRADSIILCNKNYGIGKKCDTIPRPGYAERMKKK